MQVLIEAEVLYLDYVFFMKSNYYWQTKIKIQKTLSCHNSEYFAAQEDWSPLRERNARLPEERPPASLYSLHFLFIVLWLVSTLFFLWPVFLSVSIFSSVHIYLTAFQLVSPLNNKFILDIISVQKYMILLPLTCR